MKWKQPVSGKSLNFSQFINLFEFWETDFSEPNRHYSKMTEYLYLESV